MEPGPQFHQYKKTTYRIEPAPPYFHPRGVAAYHEASGAPAGRMQWWADGTIADVFVPSRHRGRGVADAMLRYAQTVNPALHHSDTLTPEGKAWSEKHPL